MLVVRRIYLIWKLILKIKFSFLLKLCVTYKRKNTIRDRAHLIFVTNITNYIRGEEIVMWRNFSFPCMTIVGIFKISSHIEKFQMSPHDRCGGIWNSPHVACVWCRKRRQICKIYCILCRFVAKSVIHDVLSQNFMWRKIEPKSTFMEEKWQISGLRWR